LNNHPKVLAVPGLAFLCQWKPVRINRGEQVQVYVGAVHAEVAPDHYIQALLILKEIYNSKNKKDYPLDIKWTCIPDAASSANTSFSPQYLEMVRCARCEQLVYQQSVTTLTSDKEILDLYTPFDAADPNLSLNRVIMGIVDPNTKRPLIHSVFQKWDRPECHVFTVRTESQSFARAVLSALGIICSNRYGDSIWSKFYPGYKERQEMQWQVDATTKKYQEVQMASTLAAFATSSLSDYVVPPLAGIQSPMDQVQINLPGTFRVRAPARCSAVDATEGHSQATSMVNTISPSTFASEAEDSFDDDMLDLDSTPSHATEKPPNLDTPPPKQIECTRDGSNLADTTPDALFTTPSYEPAPEFRVKAVFNTDMDLLVEEAHSSPLPYPPDVTKFPDMQEFHAAFEDWLTVQNPQSTTHSPAQQFTALLYVLGEIQQEHPELPPYEVLRAFTSPTHSHYTDLPMNYNRCLFESSRLLRKLQPMNKQVEINGEKYYNLTLCTILEQDPALLHLQQLYDSSWLSASTFPEAQLVPRFLLDYTYCCQTEERPEDLLHYILEHEDDIGRLRELQHTFWATLQSDHQAQADRTLELVNTVSLLHTATESIPWTEAQQTIFDDIYTPWSKSIPTDPHLSPDDQYSTILAFYKLESRCTTNQEPRSHFSLMWKEAPTAREPLSCILWRLLNEWRVGYIKDHHCSFLIDLGITMTLPVIPAPWCPQTRTKICSYLEDSWIQNSSFVLYAELLPDFIIDGSTMDGNHPIETAREIQYYMDSDEETQVGQLRQKQMDLYNSLLASNEIIKLDPPLTDEVYLSHSPDDNSDAMATESITNIPHDNMDTDDSSKEHAHSSDGGQSA
jgi:hypothetical protein